MTHYIALIHKDADSCYGVSFPDVPGAFTVGDTIDEAIENAGEVLGFAAEDWSDLNGDKFPRPRTIDELRADPTFRTLHRMRSLQRCLCGNPYWRWIEAAGFRILRQPLIFGASVNNRKEVIQCLIVIRRVRQPRPGCSPLPRSRPEAVKRAARSRAPDRGPTMEGPSERAALLVFAGASPCFSVSQGYVELRTVRRCAGSMRFVQIGAVSTRNDCAEEKTDVLLAFHQCADRRCACRREDARACRMAVGHCALRCGDDVRRLRRYRGM
jgi:antitoxin HicB